MKLTVGDRIALIDGREGTITEVVSDEAFRVLIRLGDEELVYRKQIVGKITSVSGSEYIPIQPKKLQRGQMVEIPGEEAIGMTYAQHGNKVIVVSPEFGGKVIPRGEVTPTKERVPGVHRKYDFRFGEVFLELWWQKDPDSYEGIHQQNDEGDAMMDILKEENPGLFRELYDEALLIRQGKKPPPEDLTEE